MKQDPEQTKALEEVPLPETPPPGEPPKPWGETRFVGKPLPRVDAYDRLSGTAIYPSDVVLPNMLYGAILRCPHPNALVENVDTSKAEKLPGVSAVITGATPGADLKWTYSQWRPPKEVQSKLFDAHCRFEGDAV